MIRNFSAQMIFLALVVAGCEKAATTDADRLALVYASAATEFRVPQQILEGIGWAESRWSMNSSVASNDECYGTMHLCDWGEDGTLAHAARLTGLSVDVLKTDREANIRGAAAVLRNIADKYFADVSHLSDKYTADWWQVVMRYSNAADPEIADSYATQVYYVINRGDRAPLEDGSVFELRPSIVDVSREKLFGVMPSGLRPDYPDAKWKAAIRFSSRNNTPIDRVVIHTAQGSYAGTISWFQDQRVQASAQYVVRSSDGDITQMVEDKDMAWHAGNSAYNRRSIGIEHEGYVDNPAWLTDKMYNASAALTRWLCDTYNIPKDRNHIIGHNEVPNPKTSGCGTQDFGGCSGHSDPCVTRDGKQCFWDWTRYMQLVGGTSAPTTGIIRGTVFSNEGGCAYQGGFKNCDTVIAGARVFIAETGDTLVSSETGTFKFDIAPGTYSPWGSASGFHDAGPVLGPRPVVAGGTAWSSIILEKFASSSAVKGFVYGVNPSNASDRSQRLDGAIVSSDESNLVSANTNGEFKLTVPVGAVTVTATKAGWAAKETTVTTSAGVEHSIEIGLTANVVEEDPTDGGEDPVDGGEEDPVEDEGIDGVVRDLGDGAAIKGAVVSVGDAIEVTDAQGRYSLDVVAGSYSVSVHKPGYIAKSFDVSVSEGLRTEANLFISSADAGALLTITSPANGSTVDKAQVEVRGTVTLSPSPTVKVDGVLATVTGTEFVAQISLNEGENSVSAFARTEDGRSVSTSVKLTYAPTTVAEDDGCGCAGTGPGTGLIGLLLTLVVRRQRPVRPV